ncbi:MAG: alcohol dehydrogenase [Moraxellaceae bacterium]|nr:MAG: alcohol dehydrogenase [Moraxellaceae bacterium]
MMGFIFSTTQQIICEPGASAQLGEICQRLAITHLMVVTDPGIVQLGLLDVALASLQNQQIPYEIYSQVVADPPESIVHEAVAQAKNIGANGVVGFGGGSSMDVAKLVALLVCSSQSLADVYGVGNATGERLPLIQVPTTAGTGSEVTPIAIVTTGKSTKQGVVSPILLPDVALLDANLTVGLPSGVTAATGIDAMVHAIEAFTSVHKKNPYSDMLAKEALHRLSTHILAATSQGDDVLVRSEMLYGAMLAGQAFANAPVAAVHALAYPLGGHYHISHGLSNSLVLPHVLRFNLSSALSHYAELAPILDKSLAEELDPLVKASGLISAIETLIKQVGLPTQLRELGVEEDMLPMLAKDAMLQERLLMNNPRPMTYDDALAIYQAAF